MCPVLPCPRVKAREAAMNYDGRQLVPVSVPFRPGDGGPGGGVEGVGCRAKPTRGEVA